MEATLHGYHSALRQNWAPNNAGGSAELKGTIPPPKIDNEEGRADFKFSALRHSTQSSSLELELIQSHMEQKPVLRGEVGCACVAREVSVERGGMGT